MLTDNNIQDIALSNFLDDDKLDWLRDQVQASTKLNFFEYEGFIIRGNPVLVFRAYANLNPSDKPIIWMQKNGLIVDIETPS